MSVTLAVEDSVWILWSAARALGHLHDQIGLAHGDVHLGNLMVDTSGLVILIDYTHSTSLTRRYYNRDVQKDIYTMCFNIYSATRERDQKFESILAEVHYGNIKTAPALASALEAAYPQLHTYRAGLASKVQNLFYLE